MKGHIHIGEEELELEEIDSTNSHAMRLINEGVGKHGLLISSQFQTAGKGQQGNSWQSEKGKNLLFSFILKMDDWPIEKQFVLNACFCLAIANHLMETYEMPNVSIKWPNDVYVGKKKIAGILIENVLRGAQWQYCIVGIGLNVNQGRFLHLKNGTSIQIESGKTVPIHQCKRALLTDINAYYNLFLNKPQSILNDYQKQLMGFKEKVHYSYRGEVFSGELLGVNDQCELEMHTQGKNRSFRHKQIELIF